LTIAVVIFLWRFSQIFGESWGFLTGNRILCHPKQVVTSQGVLCEIKV